jgi:Aerotolerance regulator N-terminal/von Willebrand factor type A domain
MPIAFANPAMLLGGLMAALPVVIHFLSRKKVQKKKFSDLRFLHEVQARQARSLGIRRWLLLLLRILAILALTVAVSGPRWGGLATGASGSRSLVFVIDTSASMNTQQENGTRLEEALTACSEMIASLPGDASVQVVTSGSRTLSLFGDWLPAGTGVVTGLAAIRPTDGAFDLTSVIRETARLIARAPSQPVDVIIVSDFQEISLPQDLKTATTRFKEAGESRIITRPVGQVTAGGGIQKIILPQRALQRSESVEIRAMVTSNLPDQVFTLELDGRHVAEAVLAQPTVTPRPLDFALSVPGAGVHTGYVRKPSDGFASDDERPFVLTVPNSLSILLVHGEDREVDPPAGRGGWRYLAEALSPGGSEGIFDVKEINSRDLTSGDLTAATVAIFVDPDPLGLRGGETLQNWLKAGGVAAFVVGEPTLAGYLDSFMLPALGLVAGTQPVLKQPGQQQRVKIMDPEHPIFQGLGPEALTTFEDITWNRWLRLPAENTGVLLELADESPLLMTGTLEQGRFVVMPFNLLPSSGKISGSPMALPFFQRLISWLATGGLGGAAVNTEVGQRASIKPIAGTSPLALENAEQLMILNQWGQPGQNADLVWQSGTPRLLGDVLDRAGFVTFLSGRDTLGVVAGQIPAEESVIGLWMADDWARQLGVFGLEVRGQLGSGNASDLAATLSGRDLAHWFFGLAFCLLLTELFVGRGTGRKEAAPH